MITGHKGGEEGGLKNSRRKPNQRNRRKLNERESRKERRSDDFDV